MRTMVLKKCYKGNTLPEVLIAIVIMSFASVMGVSIYLNIRQNTQPFLKLKALELAQQYIQQTEEKREYLDREYKEEEFSINKTVTHSEEYPDCILITISVTLQPGKKICELQKLVHAD